MTWTDPHAPSEAPSVDDLAALARKAFNDLPADVRRQAGDVMLRVDDFASDEVLDGLGIEDPFELTGRSIRDSSPPPWTVVFYRRPILDEWFERGDLALGDLITHVLVQELGKVATVVEPPRGPSAGEWGAVCSPSIAEFAEIASQALAGLPPRIKAAVGEVQIRIEDFADADTLEALAIEDAFELTGVYEGVDLLRRSVLDPGPAPSSIRLFRRPILDEWSEGGVGFRSLVEHVLVHEIAHHFGFSDAGIEHVEQS